MDALQAGHMDSQLRLQPGILTFLSLRDHCARYNPPAVFFAPTAHIAQLTHTLAPALTVVTKGAAEILA